MQSGESHLQGYNCKLLVDIDYQVIVAVRVCNQPQNVEQLDPMPQRIVATTGARPDLMWMGAGYSSEGSGLRRFLLRVLGKADAEWHLIAATNNLLKLFRYQLTQQLVLVAATG